MKITLSTIDLQEVNSKMGRLIAAKADLPILSGVLVKAENNIVVFTASDGNESIIHRILMDKEDGNEVIEDGISVFTKEVFDVVKKLSKGVVSFEVKDTLVSVTQAKTKLEFATMNATDYPAIEAPNTSKPLILTGAEFSEIVNQTTFSTSKTETRPILMGVNMNLAHDCCQFVATDSHRLSKLEMRGIESINEDEQLTITVPATILDQAMKSFDLSKDIIILPSEQTIALANGNTILLTRLLEGNFPETSRLIPTEFKIEVVTNRLEFIQALELLQLVSEERVVTLKTNEMFVELHAKGAGSKGQREIAFSSYEGETDFTVAFSPLYVLDVLKRMESTSVRFRFTESMRPFLVMPESLNDGSPISTQLILPVRQY